MPDLTLAQASTIVDAALAKAKSLGLKPLTVVVLDAGGVYKALKKEDGMSLMRPDIAFGKAWGALGVGVGSRAIAKMAEARPMFVTALMGTAEGRIVPVPGGVLIRDASGAIIGAVGVTGDTSDNDEVCAIAGIEAAGLKADPGEG